MDKLDNYKKGCFTFLIGSLAFTQDALKQKPISKPYLIGCMFFNIGCFYFIKDSYKIK